MFGIITSSQRLISFSCASVVINEISRIESLSCSNPVVSRSRKQYFIRGILGEEERSGNFRNDRCLNRPVDFMEKQPKVYER